MTKPKSHAIEITLVLITIAFAVGWLIKHLPGMP